MNLAPGRFQVIEMPPPPPLNPNARKIVAHISQSIWLPPFGQERAARRYAFVRMDAAAYARYARPAHLALFPRTHRYTRCGERGLRLLPLLGGTILSWRVRAMAPTIGYQLLLLPLLPPLLLPPPLLLSMRCLFFLLPVCSLIFACESPVLLRCNFLSLSFFPALLYVFFLPSSVFPSFLPPRSQSGVNGFLLLRGCLWPNALLPLFQSLFLPLYIPLLILFWQNFCISVPGRESLLLPVFLLLPLSSSPPPLRQLDIRQLGLLLFHSFGFSRK